jgi:hypothetical protein
MNIHVNKYILAYEGIYNERLKIYRVMNETKDCIRVMDEDSGEIRLISRSGCMEGYIRIASD